MGIAETLRYCLSKNSGHSPEGPTRGTRRLHQPDIYWTNSPTMPCKAPVLKMKAGRKLFITMIWGVYGLGEKELPGQIPGKPISEYLSPVPLEIHVFPGQRSHSGYFFPIFVFLFVPYQLWSLRGLSCEKICLFLEQITRRQQPQKSVVCPYGEYLIRTLNLQ